MPWKLYAFEGADGRTRYLESEAELSAGELSALYETAKAEVLAAGGRMDRIESHIYRDYPFPPMVLDRLVEAHGFRRPEPAATVGAQQD